MSVSGKKTFILNGDIPRAYAKEYIDLAPHDYICIIQQRTRSLDQNALLHKVLTDIARQVEWQGQKFPIDVWKRLCVASWLREKNEKPMMIPALDGHGIDVIYEKTSTLKVSECAELIEWCFAFGAEHGVQWSAYDGFADEREKLRRAS